MAPVSYFQYELKLVDKSDEEKQASKEQFEALVNKRTNPTMEYIETNRIPQELYEQAVA
jgi:hypothetical protein